MFDDFDVVMCEMGVGDFGVGKKICFMVEGFYGCVSVYDEVLKDEDVGELDVVIVCNIFVFEVLNVVFSEFFVYVWVSVERFDV